MIIRPKPPFGYTVFCDDIREESSGKVTLVGSYSGSMIVNGQTPLMIPMLCAQVAVYMDEDAALRGGTLQLCKIGRDDIKEVLNSVPLPEVGRKDLPVAKKVSTDVDMLLAISLSLRITPYQIDEEHLLRMVLIVGDDEYRLGALSVEIANLAS